MTQSGGDLAQDPFLRDVPVVEGYKTLGPCVLFAKLGQGGMGAVYRARHLNLDIDVAVKCLLPNLGQGGSEAVRKEAIQRFVREARVAAQLGHENLVRVFDVAESRGVHYLVMEFVDGETLRGRVQRKGALAPTEAVTITLAAARGLAAAHRKGIIHRDIKPDNVMISREGEVKLADLGLARAADAVDSLATSRGAIMGTPSYMPPEQFVDASQVGPAADVWSLGATLHFLLTGENGITASTPVQAMHQVCNVGFPVLPVEAAGGSTALAELVARCMQSEASVRYADAGELAQALIDLRLAPEMAALLADPDVDPDAGTVLNLVSPPPAKTLDRIRSFGSQSERTTHAAEDFDVDYPTAPASAATIPSTRPATPGDTESVRPSANDDDAARKKGGLLVPLLLVAVLGLGGYGAWAAGLFGEKKSDEEDGGASRVAAQEEGRGEGQASSETPQGGASSEGSGGAADPPPAAGPENNTSPAEGDPTGGDPTTDSEADDGRETPDADAQPGPPVETPSTIAERLREARAMIADPTTRAAGIEALRGLADEAPQTVGLGPALSGALRTQATTFRDEDRWPEALRAARESLDVSEHPATRRLETAIVETIRQTMASSVRLATPGSIARTSDLQLEGRVTSGMVTGLSLGGENLAMSEGAFTHSWSAPAAGEHELVLVARGPEGIEVPVRTRVRVDLAEPQVTLTAPTSNTIINGDAVEVVGRVTDDLAVASLRFRDGAAIPVDEDGRFRARFPFVAGTQGEVEIVILAKDAADREGFASVKVRRQVEVVAEKIAINLLEPTAAQRAQGRRPIPVTFELTSGSLKQRVLINGRPASRLNTKPPRYRGNLRSGEDRLKIVTQTEAGQVLLRDEPIPLMKVPNWCRVKVGVSLDPASGLPREVTDKRSGITMILVPAGSYLRGASAGDAQALDDEKPAHRVTLSQPFYLGKYEVTNAQYEKFWPRHNPPQAHGLALDKSQSPVVHVNWDEARAYCNAMGLRLPTEAEWECAARAGKTSRYPWGDDPKAGRGWASVAGPATNARLWFGQKQVFPFNDGHDVTAPVGSFRANAYGFHDMSGNVWEWCADFYDAKAYANHGRGVTDPRGPAQGPGRVLRGGSWQNVPAKLRLSARGWLAPTSRYPDLGFRVARHP